MKTSNTMDQMFKLFRDKKTLISTIKDPVMFFRHLKDRDIITKQLFEKLEPNEESVYIVLESIEKGGEKRVNKFWNCVNEEHILKRYRQLSELNKIVQSFQVQKERSEKHEKGEELKTTESSSMGRDGPSSLSITRKRKPAEHDDRGYQSPRLGKNNKGDGKTREVKKKKTESSSSSLRAEPPSTSEDEDREVKLDLWDMPKYKRWLPVTCGIEKALLDRYMLKQRKRDFIKKCGIMISPYDFEEMGMREWNKNWKTSIKCQDKTLKALMKMGKLKVPHYNGKFTLRK